MMRLRIHTAAANEELIALVNEGYSVLSAMQADYRHRKKQGTYDDTKDVDELLVPVNSWANKVVESLGWIFPTPLERHLFLDPEIPFGAVSGDYKYECALTRCRHSVRGLNKIRLQSLPEYTDLPPDARLYVEDIAASAKFVTSTPRPSQMYCRTVTWTDPKTRSRLHWNEFSAFRSTKRTGAAN